MSRRERSRLEVMSRVRDKDLSVAKAAELLELSVRQARRIWKRYRESGDAGLVHGLRGKSSNRSIPGAVKQAVLELYRRKYAGFGPTLACEHLREEDGQKSIKAVTLWRWLLKEGLWSKRIRRSVHRSRRERKEHWGQMVQMDGSHHDWFEGRGPWCVLMVMVDDATGRTFARFYESETTRAAFDVFGAYVRKYGLPRSLYVDRDSIYRSDRDQASVEESLRGQTPLTQFARAMKQLEVKLILANSPQAKGRVERMNGTLQDRLVKEMRLAGINDIASANRFLTEKFLASLNRKFAIPAKAKADLHRALERDVKLEEVLCFCQERSVSRDWCVRWNNRVLQLDKRHQSLALAGRKVTVRQKLDGTLELIGGAMNSKLTFKQRAQPPQRPPSQDKKTITNNQRWKPPARHPWQQPAVPRANPAPATPARGWHAEEPLPGTVLLK